MRLGVLVLTSLLSGCFAAIVLRYASPSAAVGITRKRIQAHLMEFRLFFDEPGLVWNAQLQLLRANARLMLLLLPSLVILTPPMVWIFAQLDSIYGHRALIPGEPALVTAQLRASTPLEVPATLSSASGITVETPALRIAADHQLVWRVRPDGPSHAPLTLTIAGQSMQKNLDAGADSILRTSLRSRNLAWFLLNPEEPRLPAGDVEWLRIGYPATHNFGWIAWFGVISTVGAIFLGKYLPRKRVY